MNYLLNVVNTYRVPSEEAALKLREELNGLDNCDLTTFTYSIKQIKAKGEVIEEYYIVKAKLVFNQEKEPDREVSVEYD